MKASKALSIIATLLGASGGDAFAPFPSSSSSRRASSCSSSSRNPPPSNPNVIAAAAAANRPTSTSLCMSSVVDNTATATTPSSSSSSSSSSFDKFDYTSQWYPVIWSQDVPPNQPIRVTLFDVDYVLAKTTTSKKTSSKKDSGEEEEEVFYAMLDSCPHKKVALSEGRITNCGTDDKTYFQCSYHGWTFDGESGECMEIPQTLIAQNNKKTNNKSNSNQSASSSTNKSKRREDGTAVAVTVVQGMVYLHPTHTPLSALAAMNEGTLQEPPRIPEIDMEGYKTTRVIRDFPIDWTVLMENIMDPDHGYFAHSSSEAAARGFDWYSADGVENSAHLDEEFSDDGRWKIRSSVNAVDKLIEYNREVRTASTDVNGEDGKKKTTKKMKKTILSKNKKDVNEDSEGNKLIATTTFVAPSLIYMGRRTNSTATSSFLTGFWVCPTGTGKSRFMSAAIGKFAVPRWLMHIQLNNFLDQDTFLLCGQHRAVLKREAEGYLQMDNDTKEEGTESQPNNVRKSTYVYRSPSERMPVRLGQFFDATLARVPNRKEGLLTWYKQNANNDKLFESWPTRQTVLDRYEQHTQICPDSMSLVKKCDKAIKRSKLVGLAMIFMKVIMRGSSSEFVASSTAGGIGMMSNPFVAGTSILAATRQLLTQSSSIVYNLANAVTTCLLRGKVFYPILALAFLSHSIATRIRKEFFFKFDDELHREDVKAIAKNWVDL